jgi:hypothetical protein
MLYLKGKRLNLDYRKKSALFQGKVALLPNLTLPPTTLQWEVDLGVDDYRRKQTKKAEPY